MRPVYAKMSQAYISHNRVTNVYSFEIYRLLAVGCWHIIRAIT